MITVVGAGMAGLLAANVLRGKVSLISERHTAIPNNHKAVLRFRTSQVGDVLGIPFKKVQVMKAVHPWRNPLADALSYSLKANDTATLRSSITAKGEIVERWIAPDDFIHRMAGQLSCEFSFGKEFEGWGLKPTISTAPMPALMDVLGYKKREGLFERASIAGTVVTVQLTQDVDAYASLYVPDPTYPFTRASLMGNEIAFECKGHVDPKVSAVYDWMDLLGLSLHQYESHKTSSAQYSKILPIDDDERKRFIMWATERYKIYSLGRFATWRPGLLLDDLLGDIRVIQRLIATADGSTLYDQKKK